VQAVITSDLRRAVETVQIAFGGEEMPVRLEPRLRECNYGDLNGAPAGEVSSLRIRHLTDPFPNGESYQDVVNRTADLLTELALTYADGAHLLVVGHSANRWALQHLLEGGELALLVSSNFQWQPGWHFELPAGWILPSRRATR
jgi:broad specificity phosphatase PhoE